MTVYEVLSLIKENNGKVFLNSFDFIEEIHKDENEIKNGNSDVVLKWDSDSLVTFKPDGRTAFLTLTSTDYIKYHWGEDTSFVAWLGDYTVLIEHVESFVHKRSGFLITRIMKGNELIFENR